MCDQKWKIDIEARAALRSAEAKIDDLLQQVADLTNGNYKRALEGTLRLLRDESDEEIALCEGADGMSGRGTDWECGYIDGLRRARNRMQAALNHLEKAAKR